VKLECWGKKIKNEAGVLQSEMESFKIDWFWEAHWVRGVTGATL